MAAPCAQQCWGAQAQGDALTPVGQQDQLCLPISPSLHVGVPEERGWSSSLVPAPFPLSTWHHPSPTPSGSRTSAQPGQAGKQPGPGTA